MEPNQRPFATVVLIVLASQSFYAFHDLADPDPEVLPVWGFAAGALAWLFLRPAGAEAAGFTRRRLGGGLRYAVAMPAIGIALIGVGWLLGVLEITPGFNRFAPDLIGDLLLRVGLFYAVALLGDELAFRGILQGEASRRFGPTVGLVLVAFLYALYRIPLGLRVGLVEASVEAFEPARLAAFVLMGFLHGLALGLLFRVSRNLYATALYAWFLTAVPALFLGNAEDPLEPMRFYVGSGTVFDLLVWAGAVIPVVLLGLASRSVGPQEDLPAPTTPEWLLRNSTFTGAGRPTDP